MGARFVSGGHHDSFQVELDRLDRAWSRCPDVSPALYADACNLIALLAEMTTLPSPNVPCPRIVPLIVRAVSFDARKCGGDLESLSSLLASLRRELG